MTPNQMLSQLRDYADLLLGSGVALAINPVVMQNMAAGVVRVTSQRVGSYANALANLEFATVDEYRSYLAAQDYLALLSDGAIVQVSYDLSQRRVIRHRLCFYPCPCAFDPDLASGEPLLDVIDMYLQESPSHLRLRTPLRFDYDASREDDQHSPAHLHMQWAHCRCAVAGPLSLGRFTRFVFKHFYPSLWNEHAFLRELRQETWRRSIGTVHEAEIHLAWRELHR